MAKHRNKVKKYHPTEIKKMKAIEQNAEYQLDIISMVFLFAIGIINIIEGVINHQNLAYGICLAALSFPGLTLTVISIRDYHRDQTIERGYQEFRYIARVVLFLLVLSIFIINVCTLKYVGDSLWYIVGNSVLIGLCLVCSIVIFITKKLKLKKIHKQC